MAQATLVRDRVYNFSHAIGGGSGIYYFSYPIAVRVGKRGEVYIINKENGHTDNPTKGPNVEKLFVGAPGEEKVLLGGTKLRQGNGGIGDGPGEGDGQFRWANALALDADENIYVSDDWLNRISIFGKDGHFLGKWGTLGAGPGEINGPSGLAFDREDNLYVVDSRNHRIQRFSKDGTFLGGWGSYGGGEGEFNMPWGMTVDGNGNVYVADWKNHRVQKFTEDGAFLAQFGSPAEGAGRLTYPTFSFPTNITFAHTWRQDKKVGGLNHPSDVAVDKDGDVYVVDWANDRVQIYDPEGEFITSLLGDANQLSKWAQAFVDGNPDIQKARRRFSNWEEEWRFKMPTSIAIDNETNRIFITDTVRRRLQVYIKEEDYLDPQFNL